MSGRHGGKRKTKKTSRPSLIQGAVNESRCQEHPDHEAENHMTQTNKDAEFFFALLKDKVFNTAVTAVFISMMALGVSFWQAYLVRQTMHIDQRAWIGLSKIENSEKFAVGEPFAVTISYKDIGKTPASNVHGTATIEPRKEGEDPRFERDTERAVPIGVMIPNNDYSGSVTLTTCHLEGSNGEVGQNVTCPLTEDEYKAVDSGDQTVYFHGRVSYDGVFSFPHWFSFCYRLRPRTGVWALCQEGKLIGQQVDDENEER